MRKNTVGHWWWSNSDWPCVHQWVLIMQGYAMNEWNVLFNDALNLRLYGVRHMVKDQFDSEKGNPLLPHGLFFPIDIRVLLYAPSHRQDCTYHGLCCTSRGPLARMRNSSMGPPPWRINPTTDHTMSERSHHGATSRSTGLCWSHIIKLKNAPFRDGFFFG